MFSCEWSVRIGCGDVVEFDGELSVEEVKVELEKEGYKFELVCVVDDDAGAEYEVVMGGRVFGSMCVLRS